MMVQLKTKHKRKFIISQLKIYCSDQFLLKQTIHIKISTEYTFIANLQVDT